MVAVLSGTVLTAERRQAAGKPGSASSRHNDRIEHCRPSDAPNPECDWRSGLEITHQKALISSLTRYSYTDICTIPYTATSLCRPLLIKTGAHSRANGEQTSCSRDSPFRVFTERHCFNNPLSNSQIHVSVVNHILGSIPCYEVLMFEDAVVTPDIPADSHCRACPRNIDRELT